MSNTAGHNYLPNSQLNEGNNDSFDAEFDLLESTLSELKETESCCGKSLSEEDSNRHAKEIIAINASVSNCDNLDLKKPKPHTSLPTVSSYPKELDTKLVESSDVIVSSTIQHLKSADEYSFKEVPNDHLVCRVELNFISDNKNCCRPVCMNTQNCTINPEISNYNVKSHKNNEIVVSNCDSSMEDHEELEEAPEISTVSKPKGADMDLDVLNLECSPIPSPGSPIISNSDEPVAKELQKGPEEDVLVQLKSDESCPINENMPSNSNLKPNIAYEGTVSNNILTCENLNRSSQNDCCSSESNRIILSPICSNTDNTSNQESNQFVQKSNLSFENNCSKYGNDDVVPKVGTVAEDNGPSKGSNIYCSTPVVSKEKSSNSEEEKESSSHGTDFGYVSPLDKAHIKKKMNFKRKILDLECIEEVDEHLTDIPAEKKLKISSITNKNLDTNPIHDNDKSSAKPCFEPPAKSILKKWQPSCFSRSSASGSFLVLDECGENEEEDRTKPSDEVPESVTTDDFEVAYKSLTEELMKSSSNNIETLEKYHSQVQHENQMDDEKFDEVIQELSLNYELDEKTSKTLKSLECSVRTEIEHQREPVESHSMCVEKPTEHVNVTHFNKTIERTDETNQSNHIQMVQDGEIDEGSATLAQKEDIRAESSTSKVEVSTSSKVKLCTPDTENLTIYYADGKDMTIDEEDFLLEEDTNSKKKPYEFFEFVSTDPQENEDNYNPEWQKLGRLTSDEERYKAVRDRWRSLVPPDPNRDLTCRQWRERNHKPPLNLQSLNNNHQMYIDNERNQLCTAVFEMKIKKIVQELEDSRMNIYSRRTKDFQDLASVQDREQRMLCNRGGNDMDLAIMHKHHIEECCQLKNRYDEEFKRISSITDEKIRILKNASDEVLLFQKFYRGVGAGDDEVCLYMTDIQVQELMETEQMLEQYSKFYQ